MPAGGGLRHWICDGKIEFVKYGNGLVRLKRSTLDRFVTSCTIKAKTRDARPKEPRLNHAPSPKLFLHSRYDEIVPIEEGRRLFDAAPSPKQWVEVTGGHIYAAEKDPAFFAHVESFMVEHRLLGEEQSETLNGKQ